MLWWWSITFIFIAVALALEIVALVKSRQYRYYAGVVILVYLLVLFGLVMFYQGVNIYLVRSGLFTAVGMVALVCLHMVDLISCYHGKKKKND